MLIRSQYSNWNHSRRAFASALILLTFGVSSCADEDPPHARELKITESAAENRYKLSEGNAPKYLVDGLTGQVWRVTGKSLGGPYYMVPVCIWDPQTKLWRFRPDADGSATELTAYCAYTHQDAPK